MVDQKVSEFLNEKYEKGNETISPEFENLEQFKSFDSASPEGLATMKDTIEFDAETRNAVKTVILQMVESEPFYLGAEADSGKNIYMGNGTAYTSTPITRT